MRYEAQLTINGEVFKVLQASFGFHQKVSPVGKPDTGALGGEIIVVLHSPDDPFFQGQMLHMHPVSGKLEFSDGYIQKNSRTIEWEEAHIYRISEKMRANYPDLPEVPVPMTLTLAIAPSRISFGDMLHIERWQNPNGCWEISDAPPKKENSTEESPEVVEEEEREEERGTEDVTNEMDVKKLNYKPTSGAVLETTPNKTTTIIGNYADDMRHIVDELGNVKSFDFGPKDGEFNILNVPDEEFAKLGEKKFWEIHNELWLKESVDRGDIIILSTEPTHNKLYRIDNVSGKEVLTGFGKEYDYLCRNGYKYDSAKKQMIK